MTKEVKKGRLATSSNWKIANHRATAQTTFRSISRQVGTIHSLNLEDFDIISTLTVQDSGAETLSAT
jgi:hypothetical protein